MTEDTLTDTIRTYREAGRDTAIENTLAETIRACRLDIEVHSPDRAVVYAGDCVVRIELQEDYRPSQEAHVVHSPTGIETWLPTDVIQPELDDALCQARGSADRPRNGPRTNLQHRML